MPASSTSPADTVATRGWLLDTLDEAGRRLDLAAQAGVSTTDPSWTTANGIAVSIKASGAAFTLSATDPDGHVLVEAVRMPRGWTARA